MYFNYEKDAEKQGKMFRSGEVVANHKSFYSEDLVVNPNDYRRKMVVLYDAIIHEKKLYEPAFKGQNFVKFYNSQNKQKGNLGSIQKQDFSILISKLNKLSMDELNKKIKKTGLCFKKRP